LKKVILSVLLAAVAISLVTVPAFAAPMGKAIPANNNPQNLYLYEKDADWQIVLGGAWGKFNYRLTSDNVVSGVFNGHGLTTGDNYSLIYYPEPDNESGIVWPRKVVILGEGTVNDEGDIHIRGTGELGVPDRHIDPLDVDYFPKQLGDKIWLVLSDDINEESFITGWNPSEYLFEFKLINTPSLD
jgi:hypothetical protein